MIQERIVDRFLRQAGQFAAPPGIYQPIADWVSEVYAGLVLAQVEDSLEIFTGVQRAQRGKERDKWYMEDLADSTERLVNLNLLRQECLKYTSNRSMPPGQFRPGKVKHRFRLTPDNFRGWKYLDDVPKLRGTDASYVEVTLHFLRGRQRAKENPTDEEYEGSWRHYLNKIDVNIDSPGAVSVERFRHKLQVTLDTLYHEVQHLGQTFLKRIKKLKEDAGLPGKSLREKGLLPPPHELRDIEFYTNLTNDVKTLQKMLGRIGHARRQEAFKKFVNENERMRSLKENALPKWQKAVSELYRAMTDQGLLT